MHLRENIASVMLMAFLASTPVAVLYAESAVDGEKVVYHLDDTANARWAMLLANAHLDQNPNARIVVVAHGPGIDFLLEDTVDSRGNPFDPAVVGLIDKGVDFRVCVATLNARNIAKDRLLGGVKEVPSGAYEIVRLQTQEGFAYLKP